MQEKFYLEEPSLKRKDAAIEYIKEHILNESNINGSGSLDKYLENDTYENWLLYLEKMKKGFKDFVPSSTYFLIRKSDDRIIGMINIRHNLNESLYNRGGNIGYGIRPTERRKGYNKINLYLGLLKCKEIGMDKALLTAFDDNIGSVKTIKSLGGVLENKIKVDKKEYLLGRYWINVNEMIDKYKNIYEDKIVN